MLKFKILGVQILNKFKRGMASSFNLFAILFICRLLVAFTASTGFITGKYSPDIMISALISIALSFLISTPVLYALKKNINILKNKWIALLYGLYFIYIGAVNISRFSYFAQTTVEEQNGKILLFASLIIIACAYSATLGIEAVSRFSSFVFIIVMLGITSIITFSMNEFSIINLFPFSKNPIKTIAVNSVIFMADSSEIALFPALAPKINGKKAKPFLLSIGLSVLVTVILIFFTIGSFGDAANLSAYPIFAMSQISTFATFERLDSVYMAFWILATFLKITVYLYAASIMIKKGKQKNNCVVCAILMFAASYVFLTNNLFAKIEKSALIIPFLIFALAIPAACLFFQKKSKGEKLLEKF